MHIQGVTPGNAILFQHIGLVWRCKLGLLGLAFLKAGKSIVLFLCRVCPCLCCCSFIHGVQGRLVLFCLFRSWFWCSGISGVLHHHQCRTIWYQPAGFRGTTSITNFVRGFYPGAAFIFSKTRGGNNEHYLSCCMDHRQRGNAGIVYRLILYSESFAKSRFYRKSIPFHRATFRWHQLCTCFLKSSSLG